MDFNPPHRPLAVSEGLHTTSTRREQGRGAASQECQKGASGLENRAALSYGHFENQINLKASLVFRVGSVVLNGGICLQQD